jgi:hypothetical protein
VGCRWNGAAGCGEKFYRDVRRVVRVVTNNMFARFPELVLRLVNKTVSKVVTIYRRFSYPMSCTCVIVLAVEGALVGDA